MTRYDNGRIPPPGQPGSPLTVIGTGTDSNGPWEFQISAHTLALWTAAKAYAEKHFGSTLHIRTGWNCYRPYDVQVTARQRECAKGNCNAAASAGYSSHGGTWIDTHFTAGVRVDAMAIDVDPNGLTWPQVWEACTAAGFLCNAITIARAGIAEPWHIIDLHPWDAVPADVNAQPFEEDDMYTDDDRKRDVIAAQRTDAIYAGAFGPKNVGATQLSWENIDGTQTANYGLLPIEIHTQQLVAALSGQIAGLATALAQLQGGTPVDMAAVQKAAQDGAGAAVQAFGPQLAANLSTVLSQASAAEVQQIASAVADEQARRLAA